MQELQTQKTIRQNLSKDDISQVNAIESKFKGSVCLVSLVDKLSKSSVGYYPINSVLNASFEISRNEFGQLNTIPSVVGG